MDQSKIKNYKEFFINIKDKLYLGVFIIIVLTYVYYQIVLASNDTTAFTKNFNYNLFAIVLPIICILCAMLMVSFGQKTGINIIAASLFAASLFGVFFYFLKSSLSTYLFNKYLLYFVTFMIIIIAISIITVIFSDTLRKQGGWTGFFLNLILYIPCLIRDGIKGAINEYNTFSNTIIILFVLELLLILMYFFLIPLIYTKVINGNVTILENPVMLNTIMPLSTDNLYNGNKPNFAISMWVYVNPAPASKEGYARTTPIFSYNNPSDHKIISLDFSNNDNTHFILDISDSQLMNNITKEVINPVQLPMPFQKWNNIVFNYITDSTPGPTSSSNTSPPPITTTTVEVYLNAKLIYTIPLSKPPTFTCKTHTVPSNNNDRITVGSGSVNSNLDGLYGAICNIMYYNKPLSELSIIFNYNLLSIKNPPL